MLSEVSLPPQIAAWIHDLGDLDEPWEAGSASPLKELFKQGACVANGLAPGKWITDKRITRMLRSVAKAVEDKTESEIGFDSKFYAVLPNIELENDVKNDVFGISPLGHFDGRDSYRFRDNLRRVGIRKALHNTSLHMMWAEVSFSLLAADNNFGPTVYAAGMVSEPQGVGGEWGKLVMLLERGASDLSAALRVIGVQHQTDKEDVDKLGIYSRARRLSMPIVDTVRAASRVGLVVGDLKPDNVIVMWDRNFWTVPEVRIIDFDPRFTFFLHTKEGSTDCVEFVNNLLLLVNLKCRSGLDSHAVEIATSGLQENMGRLADILKQSDDNFYTQLLGASHAEFVKKRFASIGDISENVMIVLERLLFYLEIQEGYSPPNQKDAIVPLIMKKFGVEENGD